MEDEYTRRRFIGRTGLTIAGAGTAMTMAAIKEGATAQMEQMSQNAMAGDDGAAPDAVAFGQSLTGLGISLLVSDVASTVEFSRKILKAQATYADDRFAIMQHGDNVWMLHLDDTYHSNPMLERVEGQDGRGRGVELRLYDQDPDVAEAQAREAGYRVLYETKNKPHGLRECYILDPDGYCWVLSRHLNEGDE